MMIDPSPILSRKLLQYLEAVFFFENKKPSLKIPPSFFDILPPVTVIGLKREIEKIMCEKILCDFPCFLLGQLSPTL
jgi:hypothetical protein